jgi:hypothetical protein
MIINSKKLLPPSKNSASNKLNAEKFLVPIKSIQYKKIVNISPETVDPGKNNKFNLKNDILIIKESVIKIDKIISSGLKLQRKKSESDRKSSEIDKRKLKENKLESNKKEFPNLIKNIPRPRLGFIDWIKKFLLNMFLGFFALKLLDHLPKLLEIGKKIIPVFNFFGELTKTLLNGLVNFIDWGYNAYDATKGFVKEIGGENVGKIFDQFSNNLNTFLNLAIIAGMSTIGGSNFGEGKKPGKTSAGEISNRRGVGGYKQAYDNMLKNRNPTKGERFVKRDYQRFLKSGLSPDDAARKAFLRNESFWKSGKSVRGGGFSVETAKDYRTAMRGGAVKPKALLSSVRPFLKRIPIGPIAALIDFGLSVALGEPLGRAAFKAIGAGVLSVIGTGFGGPLGAIIGGFAGDWAGGKLYDIFFNGKKNIGSSTKTKGHAKGGQITSRGGTSVKRTLIRRKPKPPKLKTPKVKPGRDVGGEKVISKVFNPEDTKNKNQVSSLRSLKTSSNILKNSNSNILSQTMSVGIDLAMGQKPERSFYRKYGMAFGGIVQELIDTNTQMTSRDVASSILAMANGGIVPPNIPIRGSNFGERIGETVGNMLASLVDRQASMIMTALRTESAKKALSGFGEEKETTPEGTPLEEGAAASGRSLMQGLVQRGFTKEESAAIVGNLWAESGFRTDATNPDSGAYGLMQWLGGRKSRLLEFAKEKGRPVTDVGLQLDYIKWELKGGNSYETEQFKKAMAYGPDVSSKTRGFAEQVERASAGELRSSMSKRVGAAESVYGGRMVAGERTPSIKLGKGYGSAGIKIAGELGRFIKQKLKQGPDFQAVTEHPEHGGVRGTHADGSYHYDNRAIDIGAYYRTSSGKREQDPILRVISEFNRINKVRPVELLHGGNDSSHMDHVHVAYANGGLVTKPTYALIGEAGKDEQVLDGDTTEGLNKEYPGMLTKLNSAKNKKEFASILQSYASYEEQNGTTYIIIPVEKTVNNKSYSANASTNMFGRVGGISDSQIEALLA